MDIEKVIKGIKQCLMRDDVDEYETQCHDCPYYNPDVTMTDCREALQDDVLEALKKSRLRPVIIAENFDGPPGMYFEVCPSCRCQIPYLDRYCRHCGQALKWPEKEGGD